jgi:hypothetical protein
VNGSSRPTDQLAALRAADFDIAEDQEIANVAGEVTATPKTVGTTRRTTKRPGDFTGGYAGYALKRVDEFANMSDEELRQYVYGNRKESLSANG